MNFTFFYLIADKIPTRAHTFDIREPSVIPSPANTTTTANTLTFTRKPKLRLHSGPMDKRTLCFTKPTFELFMSIQSVFKSKGMHVRTSTSESSSFKMKIVRPAQSPTPKKEKSFIKLLSSFPSTILHSVKSFTKSNNKGYDGASARKHRQSVREDGDELQFYVELKKVRDLDGVWYLDFTRRKGDIWSFKRFYEGIVGEFEELIKEK